MNCITLLKKVDESCETERIADELVVLEGIYSDYSELSKEYNKIDLKKGNIYFFVTESHRKYDIRCNPVQPSSSEIRSLGADEKNKKSALCKLERQKEKLMACKEAKLPVRRKRKYAVILQQDTQAKLMKQQKRISRLRIQINTGKEGKTLINN